MNPTMAPVKLVILQLIVIVCRPEFHIDGLLLNRSSKPLVEAVVKVIKTCYETETNTIGISGNEPDSLIASLMDGKSPIPVVLLNGATKTVGSEPVSGISRHRLQHFVTMASSSMELKESLVTIKKSRWWNHMANFYILNLPMNDDGCSTAYEILSTAWKMDLLEAKFMCIDETKRRMIYSFNPYTSDAPKPWKVEKIYRGENDHPWTLFVREYRNNYNVCDNMDFDKTKDLGGYGIRVTIVGEDPVHAVANKTGVDIIGGIHGHLLLEILHKLNATVAQLLVHDSLNVLGTVDGNGNANGILSEIFYGVTDMGFIRLSVQILTNATYIYLHSDGGLFVMTQYKGYKSQLSKLASVIDVSSRIGVCLVILVTVIFMKYVLCQNLSTAILNTMRLICNSCLVKVPTTVGSRIYLSSVFMLVVTIVGIYQGQWAAMLSKQIRLPDIDSIVDLSKSDHKIYANDYLAERFSDGDFAGRFIGVDSWNCTRYVLSYPNSAACISPLVHLLDDAARFNLHVSKHPILYFDYTLLIRENWPLEKRINELVQRLVEGGQFQYSLRRHYAETYRAIETNRNEDKNGRVKVLTLSDLSFAFAILAVGLGCATICFISEVVIYSCGTRSRNMRIRVVRPARY